MSSSLRDQRSLRSLRDTVGERTKWQSGVVAVAGVVVLRRSVGTVQDGQESVELTPSIGAVAAGRERDTQGQGALVQNEVDVLLRGGAVDVGVGAVGAAGGYSVWGIDDFDVEASAKGLHVGDYEIVSDHVVGWQDLGELSEAKSGQDGHDVG